MQDGRPLIIKATKEEEVQEETVYALNVEDTGSVSLRGYIQNHRVSLESFLDIAVHLVETLGYLHNRDIIHRDLKPENILIHPSTKKVQFIDYGGAVRLHREKSTVLSTTLPIGTLQYMSPEQTGLMGRAVDCRSDLYSLGIVFYEMLTGRLPWQTENFMGWMHAHIALKPELPEKINPDIPWAVSAVLMKLLAKTAGERYQSAHGLIQDLEKCRSQLYQTGSIEPFPLGQEDIPAGIQLPRKLYGRQKEVERLRTAFEGACLGQRSSVFINGYAGMGKTSLVQEAVKSFDFNKKYFITGKFDQLQKNIPYAPFAVAFRNLIRQLMTESQKELELWKKRILGALGRNGTVVIEVIPELEWVVGKQPQVDILPPKEAQNRFLQVFGDFVRVFARKGQPLVLFLDDLQWADPASLNLLKYLLRDADLHSLLFIGAFRENEVGGDHLLTQILEESRKDLPTEQLIFLMPLEVNQVAEFVAEALHGELEKTTVLAEVLYRKSLGNPFFLGQLLTLIYDEGLLYFNRGEGFWTWKLEVIQTLQLGEDVLEILLEKLQQLPEETHEVMKLAACIGNSFDLETLAAVSSRSSEETVSCLMPSVLAGLVLTAVDQKGILPSVHAETGPPVFEFLHDRVQQAVYSLIQDGEKKEKHLAIGRLLLQNTLKNRLEEKILSIMDHFNRSLELLNDRAEGLELAGYNLMAGRKAKASAAYASALEYFRGGRTLLPEDAWECAYQLSYDLHLELAQTEYLSANVTAAEELFDVVIGKARTELERAGVYGLKVVLYAGMGKYVEAVQTGIHALDMLGINFPVPPEKLDYARELLLYKWIMLKRQRKEPAELPEARDALQMGISELLVRLACIISIYNPKAYVFTIIKTCNYAILYGNADMASIGYAGYGIITGSMFGNYVKGYDLACIGVRLAEKCTNSYAKCYVNFVMGSIVSHWTRSAATGLDYLNKAISYGVEAGDLLLTGYSCRFVLEISYLSGHSLNKLEERIESEQAYAGRMKHEYLAVNTVLYKHVVAFLKGEADKEFSFNTNDFDEENFMESMKRDQASQAAYHILQMQLCYLSGDYEKALSVVEMIKSRMEAVTGFMITAEYNFYYSLAITALYEEMPFRDRILYRKILRKNQRLMKKWSEACKENFLHKYLLVAAETARLENRREEAMSLYDRAIQSAHENGYVQNEALANESAARFYLGQERKKIARIYMTDACRGYFEWGAMAKVRAMQEQYTGLLGEVIPEEKKRHMVAVPKKEFPSSGSEVSGALSPPDLVALLRAMQNISEETDLDRMLKGFLEFAMESAGADRGTLMLEKDGRLWVEAVKIENSQIEPIVKPLPMEKSGGFSRAVVRYVFRTLETAVLNQGEPAGIFSGDPYITQAAIKSIACLPVLFRGIPAGILYLENSLLEEAFMPERLELLKLLSVQLISVKKLQTYLEGKSEEGRQETPPMIEPLTRRETEVLQLIAAGMANKEIADRLGLTANTVKGYIKNIYEKLGVNRRVQVVARAKELNVLTIK